MKFSRRAAARTRSAVSALTGCGTTPGESTRETVAMETPAARATSAMVDTAGHGTASGKRLPESAYRGILGHELFRQGAARPRHSGGARRCWQLRVGPCAGRL